MRLRAPYAAVVVALVACGSGDRSTSEQGTWRGTEHDSAGVVFVENVAGGSWTDETRWTVEEDLSIGSLDGPPEYLFAEVSDVDTDSFGNIYVLDALAESIRIFDRDGSLKHSFGEMGDGPGEFTPGAMPRQLVVRNGGEVWVPDIESRRAHRYGPDGTLVETVQLSFWGTGLKWLINPAGGFIHSPRGDDLAWAGLVRVMDHGAVSDTLHAFSFKWATRPAAASAWQPLLLPSPAYAITTDGKIVTGIVDQYRIEIRAMDGTLERVVTGAAEAQPLSDAQRSSLIERGRRLLEARLAPLGELDANTRAMIAAVEWGTPDRLPVFTDLVGGPNGTIWVRGVLPIDSMAVEILNGRSSARGAGSGVWEVFSREGRLLGQVELPPRFVLQRIKGDLMYGVSRDDLDVESVVRLRIRRPQGTA